MKIRNVELVIDTLVDIVIEFNGWKYFFRYEGNGERCTLNFISSKNIIYTTKQSSTLYDLVMTNFHDEELLQMKYNGQFIFRRTNEWEMKGDLAEIELVRHDDGKDDPEKEFTIYTKNDDGESVACFFSLFEMRKIAAKINELVKQAGVGAGNHSSET